MSSALNQLLPVIGAPVGSGFFAGVVDVGGNLFAIIAAPKVEGERTGAWLHAEIDLPSAGNYLDGRANTDAMAVAGSDLSIWARSVRIGNFDDWYIPAREELALVYRNLKATVNDAAAATNTDLDAYRQDGPEELLNEWYWSSTQVSREHAWSHDFYLGTQGHLPKELGSPCRLVRRVPLGDLLD